MGRGRAKAKQTKVARDLKYRPMDTDFASLERELRGGSYTEVIQPVAAPESGEVPEEYADIAEQYGADVPVFDGHDDGANDSRR